MKFWSSQIRSEENRITIIFKVTVCKPDMFKVFHHSTKSKFETSKQEQLKDNRNKYDNGLNSKYWDNIKREGGCFCWRKKWNNSFYLSLIIYSLDSILYKIHKSNINWINFHDVKYQLLIAEQKQYKAITLESNDII